MGAKSSTIVYRRNKEKMPARDDELRAAIKEIIEEMCSENYGLDFENFANIEVLKIIRTDTLNFNNVWNKDLYKKFLSKKIK